MKENTGECRTQRKRIVLCYGRCIIRMEPTLERQELLVVQLPVFDPRTIYSAYQNASRTAS
jgi:hypothetical protein